jgi:hypothetical protein
MPSGVQANSSCKGFLALGIDLILKHKMSSFNFLTSLFSSGLIQADILIADKPTGSALALALTFHKCSELVDTNKLVGTYR